MSHMYVFYVIDKLNSKTRHHIIAAETLNFQTRKLRANIQGYHFPAA